MNLFDFTIIFDRFASPQFTEDHHHDVLIPSQDKPRRELEKALEQCASVQQPETGQQYLLVQGITEGRTAIEDARIIAVSMVESETSELGRST